MDAVVVDSTGATPKTRAATSPGEREARSRAVTSKTERDWLQKQIDDLMVEVQAKEAELEQSLQSLAAASHPSGERGPSTEQRWRPGTPRPGTYRLADKNDPEVEFRSFVGGAHQTSGYGTEIRTMRSDRKLPEFCGARSVGGPTGGPLRVTTAPAVAEESPPLAGGGRFVVKELNDSEALEAPTHSTPLPLKRDKRVHNEQEFEARFKLDNRRPSITPDRFDGKIAWRDYQKHFEACRQANSWNEDQSASFLAASLQGTALKVLSRCHQEGRCPTYAELFKLLEAQFGPGQMAKNYLMELRNRRQGPKESLRELGQAVRELVILAYPEF